MTTIRERTSVLQTGTQGALLGVLAALVFTLLSTLLGLMDAKEAADLGASAGMYKTWEVLPAFLRGLGITLIVALPLGLVVGELLGVLNGMLVRTQIGRRTPTVVLMSITVGVLCGLLLPHLLLIGKGSTSVASLLGLCAAMAYLAHYQNTLRRVSASERPAFRLSVRQVDLPT